MNITLEIIGKVENAVFDYAKQNPKLSIENRNFLEWHFVEMLKEGHFDAILGLDDKPTTKVVAKPIEWEELNARGDKNHRFSKEMRYAIEHKQDGTFYAYVCLGLEIGLFSTEAEAVSACQAHAQDKVDRFLLDCDIVITPTQKL